MNKKMATRGERKSDREEMIARMDANTSTKATLATQVKINETMQENIQDNLKQMIHGMRAYREQRKAEREADREQRRADMEEILAKMEERMTATKAKTDGKVKELTERIKKRLQSQVKK
jgi:bacterioferritin (cytochrome b1)